MIEEKVQIMVHEIKRKKNLIEISLLILHIEIMSFIKI